MQVELDALVRRAESSLHHATLQLINWNGDVLSDTVILQPDIHASAHLITTTSFAQNWLRSQDMVCSGTSLTYSAYIQCYILQYVYIHTLFTFISLNMSGIQFSISNSTYFCIIILIHIFLNTQGTLYWYTHRLTYFAIHSVSVQLYSCILT